MIAGINPWLSMWSQPRTTIRALAYANPSYGVFWLAAVYVLQRLFSCARWWSLGISMSPRALFFSLLFSAPVIGLFWLYFTGWVYRWTGRWLRGEAPQSSLRAAVAWSKIPTSLAVPLWFFLGSEEIFIFSPDLTSALIALVSFATNIWAFILLVQGIREVQGFGVVRSLVNIALASIVSTAATVLGFSIFRFIYVLAQ